jgi:hypothetical protein
MNDERVLHFAQDKLARDDAQGLNAGEIITFSVNIHPFFIRIFAACKFLNYEQKRKSAGGDEWRY